MLTVQYWQTGIYGVAFTYRTKLLGRLDLYQNLLRTYASSVVVIKENVDFLAHVEIYEGAPDQK